MSAGALFDGEAKSVRTVNLIEKGGHHPTSRQRVPQPQLAESRQLTNDALCQNRKCRDFRIRTFRLLLLPRNTGPFDPGLQRSQSDERQVSTAAGSRSEA